MSESLSERQIIRKAAAGSAGAFSRLVDRYRPSVLRTAYGIVGSSAAAEDIAQEVFIQVWRKLPNYADAGAFSSWIYRITVNAAIDMLRKRPFEMELACGISDGGTSPEQIVLSRDAQRQLWNAVCDLPPKARAALVLREFEGLTYKEIAEALQIPIGTVMSRLNYARRRLRAVRQVRDSS